MSEDEATEKLKELVIRCKECKFATCENCEINWNEVQAIETMLDLYKQEKEKNTDFEKYWVSIDDYNELKRQVKIKNEYLSLIIGIGFDYDGEDGSIEGLKSVIDQLVDYARKAIDNDDKSPIYGIDNEIPKRNVLLEEIDNHIPRID